jgi:Domain of unknown function (DUF4382)
MQTADRSCRAPHVHLAAVSVAAALMLAACGGGGDSSTPPTADTGTLNIRLVDGPSSNVTHSWITVTQVAVNADDAVDMSGSGWTRFDLPTPVSLDMMTLANGSLSSVIASLNLPAGTYKQIRLVLAGSSDALTGSAVAAGLTYNDQVTYVDSSGASQIAPLEVAQARQGVALWGTFDIVAGGSLNLAIEFDVGEDVVPFLSSTQTAYVLQPHLRYFDLDQSAAIVGRVDASACAALATNPCGDLVVKAEQPSIDGSVQQVARWTKVMPDGSFTLFPVQAAAGQTYDVIVRGDYAQTMLVRSVAVSANTSPGSNPTTLSAAPLALAAAPGFSANWSGASNPTGVKSRFYQTLVPGTAPYEVRGMSNDPFSGVLSSPLLLADGDVMVGSYAAGGNPSFSPATPAEGSGGYLPALDARGINRSLAAPVRARSDGSITPIATPTLTPAPKVAGFGNISGRIGQSVAGKFDAGYVVVTRGGQIVNTADIGAALQANGGQGGAYNIGNLPAGSAAMPYGMNGNGPGIYFAYLRVWNSANPAAVTIVPINGSADLNTVDTATLNVTTP